MDSRAFDEAVFDWVARIPAGRVATYGQLAFLAGAPRRARHTGRALHHAPAGLPCHRVVNAAGCTAPGWAEQTALLRDEGVRFKENGCVDMKLCRWRPEEIFGGG